MSGIKKEGFLEKIGGNVRNWKRRWFVLQSKSLDYYKKRDLNDQCGSIPIIDCTLSIEPASDAPGFYFMIKLPARLDEAKRTEYLIRASSEEERAEWMEAIRVSTVITVTHTNIAAALKVNPRNPGVYLPIPYFIRDALNFLNENCLEHEGLYRLPGSTINVNNMLDQANQNQTIEFREEKDTCSFIKGYLSRLSEPIFPCTLIETLSNVFQLSEDKQIEPVKNIIHCLPIPNYVFLHFFFSHILKLFEKQEVNKMNMQAINVCIGPSLIRSPDVMTCQEGSTTKTNGNPFKDSNIQQSLCEFIVKNFYVIFSDNPLMLYSSQVSSQFYQLARQQESEYPYVLDVPVGSVVQSCAEDKTGWTICVCNDKWGIVHRTSLTDVKDQKTLLKSLGSQTEKWKIAEEKLQEIRTKSPEAYQLYNILYATISDYRQRATKVK